MLNQIFNSKFTYEDYTDRWDELTFILNDNDTGATKSREKRITVNIIFNRM